MTEWIIITISGGLLLVDSFVGFLPKSLLPFVVGLLFVPLLHVIIKDAVIDAIKELKESIVEAIEETKDI